MNEQVEKQVTVLTPDIIRKYICPLATEQEIYLFLQLCKGAGLNPFLREAYLIKYSATKPAAMVTGKDTFLKRARHNPHYRGFKAGIIVQAEKKIIYKEGSALFPGEQLIGGWAEVYRDDREAPIRAEVGFDEYAGKKSVWKDGEKTEEEELNSIWKGKPATMIRKVSICQAHREAVDELEGLYAPEEMGLLEVELPAYEFGKAQPGYIEPPKQKGPSKQSEPPEEQATTTVDGLDQQRMQVKIKQMLIDIYVNEASAMDELERLSAWTKDGVSHAGKRNVFDLAVKAGIKGATQTSVIYHQVKKTWSEWRTKINADKGDEQA